MQHPDWHGYPPPGQTWTRGTPNSWTTSAGDEKLGLVYRADRQRRRRLYLGRPDAAGECVCELDRRDRRDHREAAVELPDGQEGRLGLRHRQPAEPGRLSRARRRCSSPSKQGDLYVLDRATGKPLAPVGTIAAPLGGVEPTERAPQPDRRRCGTHCASRTSPKPTCGACRRSTRWLPHPVSPGRLSRLLHAAARRQVHGPISRLQRRQRLGQRVDRSGARDRHRQLQRHAQLRAAGPARRGEQGGHHPALRDQHAAEQAARRSIRNGACLMRSRSTPAGACRSPS